MHLHPTMARTARIVTPVLTRRNNAARPAASPEAIAEFHAYIAARDLALAEAERSPSNLTLSRATIANDLVRSYTQPVSAAYAGQSLPEHEAQRERLRCDAVAVRICELRHKVVNNSRTLAAA